MKFIILILSLLVFSDTLSIKQFIFAIISVYIIARIIHDIWGEEFKKKKKFKNKDKDYYCKCGNQISDHEYENVGVCNDCR